MIIFTKPKIRNDNFYKCNIKHINIFVGDVNPNLDSYDNTMFNNINISKENIRQNTIEYNNQIFDINQTKKVENNYEVKTIDSFNQTKNGNILAKIKNIQSFDLANKNSDTNKNYIRLYDSLNIKRFINLMQFSWMAKMKDNKNNGNSWKDSYFRLNILNKITKRKESSAKRLYKKIKSSIEKDKSKKEPNIKNGNSFKFNIKNINVFVKDVNSSSDRNNNSMRNNISLSTNRISKNISNEKIRLNSFENRNQIFGIRQIKKMKNTYKIKTINSFNQTENRIFSNRIKNVKFMSFANKKSDINKNYICLCNSFNAKTLKPQKYKTITERSKTKESEKNNIKSNVNYKKILLKSINEIIKSKIIN